MSTEQIAVRVPAELLEELDALVKRGTFKNRAEAVRAGIERIADLERRHRLDEAIVEGYRRLPPMAKEDAAALASLRESIQEEPW
jgi:Arc/MetJ-type ribon-helix-helix transcriptional regulator